MYRIAAGFSLALLLATLVLASCTGSPSGSPAASAVDLAAVTDALGKAGIKVAVVTDNLDPRSGAWRCLPGSFRLARVAQQPVAAYAQPGDRPSVDILIFPTAADRATAQATIGADGQVRVSGCAVMVDWIAPPHLAGARNVILFIATDDPTAVAAIKAAAASLGG
jgi:hypothetical protein